MRQTQAIIHLDNLKENIRQLQKNIQAETLFCGVVKANAYGHGAVQIARTLVDEGADFLAVALAQEAIELREAGIRVPILVFTPAETEEDLEVLIDQDVRLTCFTEDQARRINQVAKELGKKAFIHLKVDTGMSRIGVQDADEAVTVLSALEGNHSVVEGIYTHFADADNMKDNSLTHQQFDRFTSVINELERQNHSFDIKHCCNSAASIRFPDYHLDMVRIGISLYGYQSDRAMKDLIDLKPVMSVETEVAHLKNLEVGRTIGYGATYEMAEDGRIATLVIGYADGLLRSLSNRGAFVYQGQKLPIIGRVCMDQVMVDASQVNDIEVGARLTWFGPETAGIYSLFEISQESGSFHYEILTRISPRTPRIYVN